MNTRIIDTMTAAPLRSLLLELARREDDLANDEAAATPYWAPLPSSVVGHRAAARPAGRGRPPARGELSRQP